MKRKIYVNVFQTILNQNLCILLAVPGFLGWILPYFLYRRIAAGQARKLQPVIEAKEEEIYAICEKGHSLL